MAVREQLVWFSKQQEKKLALHDEERHEGWESESFGWLLDRLNEERKELQHAAALCRLGDVAAYERVIEEAADVANFAMMIADNARTALRRAGTGEE